MPGTNDLIASYHLLLSATIETRRGVFDLATSINDLQIAVVENTLAPQVTEESVVRLYDVGRYIYLMSMMIRIFCSAPLF